MSNAFRPHAAAAATDRPFPHRAPASSADGARRGSGPGRRGGNGGRSPRTGAPASRWLATPRWYLEWQLRRVGYDIACLEQQLAGEFATLETAPWVDDVEALSAERGRLLERLAQRG